MNNVYVFRRFSFPNDKKYFLVFFFSDLTKHQKILQFSWKNNFLENIFQKYNIFRETNKVLEKIIVRVLIFLVYNLWIAIESKTFQPLQSIFNIFLNYNRALSFLLMVLKLSPLALWKLPTWNSQIELKKILKLNFQYMITIWLQFRRTIYDFIVDWKIGSSTIIFTVLF